MGSMISTPVSIILLFLICSCKSDDRLTPAKPLSPGEVLISSGGIFALGFFPQNSTSNLYIGIWYHKIPVPTYVWVANRDNPITPNSSGKLALTSSSELVLSDSNGRVLWTTTSSITTGDVGAAAILLDTGNLVVQSMNGTKVWESFRHPTDTILPNMAVPLRNDDKHFYRIIAWRGPDDPSTSEYSMGGDSSEQLQIFIWNGTRPYWRRAAWRGELLSALYQSNTGFIMSQTIVSRGGEFYLTYSVSDSWPSMHMMLHYTGKVKFRAWNSSSSSWMVFIERPHTNCDRYASCGPYGYCDGTEVVPMCKCFSGFEPVGPDFSRGCRRKEKVDCGGGYSFLTLPAMKTPDKFLHIENRSFDQCATECSRNCSCTAYAYPNPYKASTAVDQSRCLIWLGELIDAEKLSEGGGGENLYLRIPSSTPSSTANKMKNGLLKILLPVMASLLILTCICLIWIYKSRDTRAFLSGRHRSRKVQIKYNRQHLNSSNELGNENIELPSVGFEDILTATNNFSDHNILGQGGFGKVYKGLMEHDKEVAVKRLGKSSGQGVEEFRNEVVLIGKLQHRNLVQLLGYCIHEDEKLLVYEYLPNKSLDYFLFYATRKYVLDWPTRFKIIKGIARGLLYLHQDSRLTIVHRDLKASNILLDTQMNPKISDFGMARIFGGNEKQENTTRVVGTYGYMSPEYALEGYFSVKSDTYSFGVLLLEIVSGLKISSTHLIMDFPDLIAYAWRLWKDGNARELVDSSIVESCPEQEVLRCIHLGLLCVQDHPNGRPLMSSIVFMLDNEKATLPTPKQPVYFGRRIYETENSEENMRRSLNYMSITKLEGR